MFKIPTESSLPLSQSVSSRPTLPQGEGEKIGLILSALFWGAEQHIILDAALQKTSQKLFRTAGDYKREMRALDLSRPSLRHSRASPPIDKSQSRGYRYLREIT
jgi:hypothetical protein